LTQDVNDEKDLCPIVVSFNIPMSHTVHTTSTQCKLA